MVSSTHRDLRTTLYIQHTIMYAAVAQLAEHSSHKARVMSSILISRKLFYLLKS